VELLYFDNLIENAGAAMSPLLSLNLSVDYSNQSIRVAEPVARDRAR
jgi:hypothetical protein